MNTSFKKEFDTYEEGIEELLLIIPDLKYYIGNTINQTEVIRALISIVSEEIPSVENDNYPNTFSITISAREVGFKTDDGIAFGWRVWIDKNNNNIIGYQFRITFLNLPRNRRGIIRELINRKWKEKTDGLQSKFWDEIDPISRVPNEKEIVQTQEEPIVKNTNVQDIPHKVEKDYSTSTPLPTFFQSDENDSENMVVEEQKEIDKSPILPTGNRPRLLGRSLFRSKEKIIQEDISEEKDQESIEEMVQAQNLIESPRETILPNGNIVNETRYIDDSSEPAGLIKLDHRYYNIRPTGNPTEVIITFEGKEFPLNVMEQHDGIYRDLANKKLRIDNVVYDYSTFIVFGLPDNYEPDQALNIPNPNIAVNEIIPDETFVPRSTIMKHADIDVEAIQEEALKREEYEARMTGIRPKLKWNRTVLEPKQQHNVLRRGKAFVIENNSNDDKEYDDMNQTQSVTITDVY